jgi:hypothetical protein
MITDTKIRALKPREKTYKVTDGLGLYLHQSEWLALVAF